MSPIGLRLTRKQAAIIGLFTGFACGPFEDIQALGDKLTGEATFTHQYGNLMFVERLKELVKPQFLAICAERE